MTPGPCRVLVADGRAAARSVVEPLLRRAGFDVAAVASSFDVLRTLRDQEVGLLLIDPELPGGGVSGVDVLRTLRGSTRFRALPALFLLAGTQPAPEGLADGALRLDTMSDEALLAALQQALGGAPPPEATGNGRLPADAEAVREAVARCCRDELREAVLEAVREVAREVVPAVAERLIREEIERLRARHGLDVGPSEGGGVS